MKVTRTKNMLNYQVNQPHIHKHEEHCSCEHNHEHEEHCSCEHEHNHEHEHQHEHHDRQHEPVRGRQSVYILENLGCAHCAAKMEAKIQMLPGVSSATITFATKQLRLTAEHPEKLLPKIQLICQTIESQVKVIPQTPAKPKKETHEDCRELTEILTGAVIFLIGQILVHTGCPEVVYGLLFLAGYLLLGREILKEAFHNIGRGQIFDENFLMSLATIGAFLIREYPEALGIMLFYRIGELFEHKAVERSRSQIMEALDLRPEVVNLVSGDDTLIIPAEEAKAGDILLIRPGDRIPLDGKVFEGSSRIDTSPITGEPVPVSVKPGDSVISGCINTSGQLKMLVEKPLAESMVSRILDSVENAAASKPKIDRFITRFAKIYTPCVVIIAFVTAIIPSLVTGDWNYWVYTALSFLVMSCPCALVLSVPLAFFSGIGVGSKKGILFKGGASIEALGKLKAVVMDKTGTITKGNFLLQKIIMLGTYSENELLRIAASIEQNSSHPIAHSITAAASERRLPLENPKHLKELAGHGIVASLKDGEILCGNQKLMEQYHIDTSMVKEVSYGAEAFLAVNGRLAGCLMISDTIKEDAPKAIEKLKHLGLHTAMLTGDSEHSARAVAKETGIEEVFAKLLPQDKLNILQNIRKEHGAVMFVGDGINDAPVLAGADVGAAMGSGADAAIEAADAVFMTSNVESIPQAISIARNTSRIAMQNVIFALAIKIAVMILGLCGHANMWMAVFADTGVAMLCVLNSIRALYNISEVFPRFKRAER